MKIEFKPISAISSSVFIELMRHPLVKRQMPLVPDIVDETLYQQFIDSKELMWSQYGYGPFTFWSGEKCIGWGGVQPENGEADLALVLHPNHWGKGKIIYQEIVHRAFHEMGLDTLTILFPPTRTRVKGILRLGFVEDQELMIGNNRFIRYRLYKKE